MHPNEIQKIQARELLGMQRRARWPGTLVGQDNNTPVALAFLGAFGPVHLVGIPGSNDLPALGKRKDGGYPVSDQTVDNIYKAPQPPRTLSHPLLLNNRHNDGIS